MEHVPVGRTLTVTASAGKGLEATLSLAESLSKNGYPSVPHLAARMISGRAELTEIVDRLTTAGVQSVFVPAGDADPPAGDYQGSLDLLKDLADLGWPFQHVGVAGYPESHPMINDDVTIQAMWDKRNYATNVVSNICFDPHALSTWVRRVRTRGNSTPMLIGLPGPVERTRLLSMATKIGVGESTKFLAKIRSMFARIAAPGGYRPERFLERIEHSLSKPGLQVEGLHIFTFNQVAETEQWRTSLLGRLEGSAARG